MITREQAEHIAAQLLGTPSGPADQGWQLEEFDAGWLIRLAASGEQRRGAAHRVVERSSGRVMRFPSSVPPSRILREYERVVPRGRVEQEAPEPR